MIVINNCKQMSTLAQCTSSQDYPDNTSGPLLTLILVNLKIKWAGSSWRILFWTNKKRLPGQLLCIQNRKLMVNFLIESPKTTQKRHAHILGLDPVLLTPSGGGFLGNLDAQTKKISGAGLLLATSGSVSLTTMWWKKEKVFWWQALKISTISTQALVAMAIGILCAARCRMSFLAPRIYISHMTDTELEPFKS